MEEANAEIFGVTGSTAWWYDANRVVAPPDAVVGEWTRGMWSNQGCLIVGDFLG